MRRLTKVCSMAAAMLVLLAACKVPVLKDLIGPEVFGAGEHLRQRLQGWQKVMGNPASPSVEQSLRLIADVDQLIQHVYQSS